MPPPIVPGIQDKNSKPEISCSSQYSDNFLSNTFPPAIIEFSLSFEMLLNLFPSLIITPSYVLSVIKILDPAPKINIFPLFL